MFVDIDDVMAELERLRRKTEEEFDGEEDSTIKMILYGTLVGYSEVEIMLDELEEDYRKQEEILCGKIEISYLTDIPDEKIIINNDYCLEVNIYHHRHCEKNTSIFRKYMFETFGMRYALDFLFNDNLVMSEEEE